MNITSKTRNEKKGAAMDTCVMCGKYAGEGRQVCLQCEYEIIQKCDRCMYEDTDMCLKCKFWRAKGYDSRKAKRN